MCLQLRIKLLVAILSFMCAIDLKWDKSIMYNNLFETMPPKKKKNEVLQPVLLMSFSSPPLMSNDLFNCYFVAVLSNFLQLDKKLLNFD